MAKSSSSAAEENSNRKILLKICSIIVIASLSLISIFYINNRTNEYTKQTLKLNGSLIQGNNLFRMNCVGCHGIKARGLVGPDLHSVTERLDDSQIITQVTRGLTPPMPSFEIEPQNMADLLIYLHSLN